MIQRVLAATAVVASLVDGAVAQVRGAADPPRIALRITDREAFRRGDRVAVLFRSTGDGYVTVLRVDTDGRVRVLFPSEPWHDNRIAGGREYAVPHPRDARASHTFQVDDYPGVGYLVAAVSRDPFRYDPYVLHDHWDYRAVAHAGRISGDPYVGVAELLERAVPPGYTAYSWDIVPYFVDQRYEYPRFLCYDCHRYVAYPVWDPYRDWCGTFRIVIHQDVLVYPARVYPPTTVVYGGGVHPAPRFVFRPRAASDPFVTRVSEPRTSRPGRSQPDRGVTGRDLRGVGSIPAPRVVGDEPASRGAVGRILSRVLGRRTQSPAVRPENAPADRRAIEQPARPKLERRAPSTAAPRGSSERPAARQPAATRPSPTVRRPSGSAGSPRAQPKPSRPSGGSARRPPANRTPTRRP